MKLVFLHGAGGSSLSFYYSDIFEIRRQSTFRGTLRAKHANRSKDI